jgi:hypothetical protein
LIKRNAWTCEISLKFLISAVHWWERKVSFSRSNAEYSADDHFHSYNSPISHSPSGTARSAVLARSDLYRESFARYRKCWMDCLRTWLRTALDLGWSGCIGLLFMISGAEMSIDRAVGFL